MDKWLRQWTQTQRSFIVSHSACAAWPQFVTVSSLLFLFGSVRQIKLAICQLLGARYRASYRIV